MTLADRLTRPPLADNAGKNTIRLDLALTRDELAVTIRQLGAKLDPRRWADENPHGILVTALALIAVAGSVAVHVAQRRGRDRRHDV